MPTETEQRMFSAHKAQTDDLTRQLAVSRASVKMLQDKVREVQADRRRLWEACYEALELVKILHGEPGWTTYHDHSPEMKRIRAALEPTK